MRNVIEEIYQKRSEKFKTGIILIFFSSLSVGYVDAGMLYLCGLPVFGLMIGYIFILAAGEKIKYIFYAMLLSGSLILYSFSMSILLLPKAETEIFLIPKSLDGKFIAIVFERSCGESAAYENKNRVYEFPSSGVLILKDQRITGKINRKFYLVDEDGNRTELPEFQYDSFERESRQRKSSKTPFTKDSAGVYPEYYSTILNMSVFNVGSYRAFEIKENFFAGNKNEMLGRFEKSAESLIEKCEKPYWRKL